MGGFICEVTKCNILVHLNIIVVILLGGLWG